MFYRCQSFVFLTLHSVRTSYSTWSTQPCAVKMVLLSMSLVQYWNWRRLKILSWFSLMSKESWRSCCPWPLIYFEAFYLIYAGNPHELHPNLPTVQNLSPKLDSLMESPDFRQVLWTLCSFTKFVMHYNMLQDIIEQLKRPVPSSDDVASAQSTNHLVAALSPPILSIITSNTLADFSAAQNPSLRLGFVHASLIS